MKAFIFVTVLLGTLGFSVQSAAETEAGVKEYEHLSWVGRRLGSAACSKITNFYEMSFEALNQSIGRRFKSENGLGRDYEPTPDEIVDFLNKHGPFILCGKRGEKVPYLFFAAQKGELNSFVRFYFLGLLEGSTSQIDFNKVFISDSGRPQTLVDYIDTLIAKGNDDDKDFYENLLKGITGEYSHWDAKRFDELPAVKQTEAYTNYQRWGVCSETTPIRCKR